MDDDEFKCIILWMLIDNHYIDQKEDLALLAKTNKYFYNRLKKSKHLQYKKDKILKYAKKWQQLSTWNRFDFPPDFKILGSYTETILGNGTLSFPLPKIPFNNGKHSNIRMVAAIWVQTPISNFFNFNPAGYTWNLCCGYRLADSITFSHRLNKWKKLDFFKGGALFPVDLFVENCNLYSSNDPFCNVKVTWVYTNTKLSDIKKYNFRWLNSKKQWKSINKNRYLSKSVS